MSTQVGLNTNVTSMMAKKHHDLYSNTSKQNIAAYTSQSQANILPQLTGTAVLAESNTSTALIIDQKMQ